MPSFYLKKLLALPELFPHICVSILVDTQARFPYISASKKRVFITSPNGKRIDGLKRDEIICMGIIYCPGRRRLFSEATVAENLEMEAYLRKNKGQIQKDLARMYAPLFLRKGKPEYRVPSAAGNGRCRPSEDRS